MALELDYGAELARGRIASGCDSVGIRRGTRPSAQAKNPKIDRRCPKRRGARQIALWFLEVTPTGGPLETVSTMRPDR